jgi:Recombinase zinc beta ribbon domain
MYVFGRYRYRREISAEGVVHKRIHAVAMADWRVSLKQHHEGYITLEEFFDNQERLEKNRTNGEQTLLAGPVREGLALLQGLLLCGTCGHALTVRYTGNGGIYPCYLCNRLRRDGLASKDCLSFRCDLLDAAIAEEVLKALQPGEIELAWAALAELESRDRTIARQWQMRLERAEYDAALAERRYQEVDPSQRLVASTLERRWNDALQHWEELKKQAAEFLRQEARALPPSKRPKCSPSPGIYRVYGMLPPHKPKIASGCCGCSLRILRSRSCSIRSNFWFTSDGRAAPAATLACSSRPL